MITIFHLSPFSLSLEMTTKNKKNIFVSTISLRGQLPHNRIAPTTEIPRWNCCAEGIETATRWQPVHVVIHFQLRSTNGNSTLERPPSSARR
jgi:hypothetical protein